MMYLLDWSFVRCYTTEADRETMRRFCSFVKDFLYTPGEVELPNGFVLRGTLKGVPNYPSIDGAEVTLSQVKFRRRTHHAMNHKLNPISEGDFLITIGPEECHVDTMKASEGTRTLLAALLMWSEA